MGNTQNNYNNNSNDGNNHMKQCPDYLLAHTSNEYKRVVMKLTKKNKKSNNNDDNNNNDDDTINSNNSDTSMINGLNLEQVLLLNPPHGVSLSFDHLGMLFNMDEEKNGYFSENNLITFTKNYYKTYCNIVKNDSITTDDALVEMDGHFTLGLWKYVANNDKQNHDENKSITSNDQHVISSSDVNEDSDTTTTTTTTTTTKTKNISLLVNWLLSVIKNLGPLQTFKSQPEIEFIHSDCLHSLYKLIDIRSSYNIDFQAFLDVVQRAGEDQGLMHLDETDFDDYCPVIVVENFLTEYFKSIINMMNELDFVG